MRGSAPDVNKVVGIDGNFVYHSTEEDALADASNMDTFGDAGDTNEWAFDSMPVIDKKAIEA